MSVSRINTGAKYNDDVFQFSVGLHGVGTKAVNALSTHFTVRSHREGRCVEARFEQGKRPEARQRDESWLEKSRIYQLVRSRKRALEKAGHDRFYEHDGFDLEEIRSAIEDHVQDGKRLRGASTIAFEIDATKKNHLVRGLDDIALTLEPSDNLSLAL